MGDGERWLPGDVVLAADRGLWCRASQHDVDQGWPWSSGPGTAPERGISVPEGHVAEDDPVRPLTLLCRGGKPIAHEQQVIEQVRALLLAGDREFDDNHTYDAHQLAKVAELVGLHVVYEPNEGCPGELLPARIQVGSDG